MRRKIIRVAACGTLSIAAVPAIAGSPPPPPQRAVAVDGKGVIIGPLLDASNVLIQLNGTLVRLTLSPQGVLGPAPDMRPTVALVYAQENCQGPMYFRQAGGHELTTQAVPIAGVGAAMVFESGSVLSDKSYHFGSARVVYAAPPYTKITVKSDFIATSLNPLNGTCLPRAQSNYYDAMAGSVATAVVGPFATPITAQLR
jgi:hypothetical protein